MTRYPKVDTNTELKNVSGFDNPASSGFGLAAIIRNNLDWDVTLDGGNRSEICKCLMFLKFTDRLVGYQNVGNLVSEEYYNYQP